VTVAISLTKNGPNILTIAPLVLNFDPAVLTFGSCAKTAAVSAGKSVSTATPMAGEITVALQGDLAIIPDGEIIDCTFTIAAGATSGGSTMVTFVSADLGDDQFNDFFPTGTNATVSIQ